MKKYISILLVCFVIIKTTQAQVKILFDATKAETAGNADWVIDADAHNLIYNTSTGLPYTSAATGKQSNPQQVPTPAQSAITSTTTEAYWQGGISGWGVDCVKKGYEVETLPYNGVISYGNSSNAQDLSHYKIFVVVEPNIVFSAAEKTAIINFVQNGGSLFMVSDHTVSDRNNDGWDSPAIWNDLFTNNGIVTNPFGMSFDLVNISGSSTNLTTNANDSLIHGSFATVSQVLWSNGTTLTINPTINPTAKAAVYKSGASNTGNTNVMVAYARYGQGKVVAFGDSSPFDDGTGDPNDQLYNGYFTDAAGNHQKLIMNATIWLATQNPLPVTLSAFNVMQQKNEMQLQWVTATEINTAYFNIQQSFNGNNFETIGNVKANNRPSAYTFNNNITNSYQQATTLYYRLEIVDVDGKKTYSEIKSLNINHSATNIIIYPNPANSYIVVKANNIKSYKVFNGLGVCVQQETICNGLNKIDIDKLPKGFYTLLVTTSDNQTTNKQFIKQ